MADDTILSLGLDSRLPALPIIRKYLELHGEVAGVVSERTCRKRIHDELYSLPSQSTPYGVLMQELRVEGENGTLVMDVLNPFALIHLACQESREFFLILKAAAEASEDNVLSLMLYIDEATPGNTQRPDDGRTFWAAYWNFLELPDWLLSRVALRWFVYTYLLKVDLQESGVTVSHFSKVFLEAFFGDGDEWNMFHTGVRITNGSDSFLIRAKYAFNIQDERAHKYWFCVKGSSGSKPCGTCENCCGRTDMFEDDSGFVHVLSPLHEKLVRHTDASAKACFAAVDEAARTGTNKEFEDLQQGLGITWDPDGIMFCTRLSLYVTYPWCIYWDWMHNYVASGGIAQIVINQFVIAITVAMDITMSDLDDFARTVTLPHGIPRLHKHFFSDRTRIRGSCVKGFAGEMLAAMEVLGLFVQTVLLETGLLERDIECFRVLHVILSIFKHSRKCDIPIAKSATQKFVLLFMELYGEYAIPKLHYIKHVIDNWEFWERLISCFSAESKHKEPKQIMQYAYNRCWKTALAMEIRRLFRCLRDPLTFAAIYLAGKVRRHDSGPLDLGAMGLYEIKASSRELVHYSDRFHNGDLLQHVGGLGFADLFFYGTAGDGSDVWLACLREVTLVGRDGFRSSGNMTIVMASQIKASIPYCRLESDLIQPLVIDLRLAY